jgi:hypothetical protein
MTMRFKSFGEMRRFAACKRESQMRKAVRALQSLNFGDGSLPPPPKGVSEARWGAMVLRLINDEGKWLC